MTFVKSFKGYEDRTGELDKLVNDWVVQHQVDVLSIKTVLSHEPNGRAKSGDLIYTVMYSADKPVQD